MYDLSRCSRKQIQNKEFITIGYLEQADATFDAEKSNKVLYKVVLFPMWAHQRIVTARAPSTLTPCDSRKGLSCQPGGPCSNYTSQRDTPHLRMHVSVNIKKGQVKGIDKRQTYQSINTSRSWFGKVSTPSYAMALCRVFLPSGDSIYRTRET